MNYEQLSKLDGFKDKKISNLLAGIEKSKTVELSNFIFALGIDGVGKKTAKDLAKKYKTLENLSNATVEDLLTTEEIGQILASNIFDYFHNEKNKEEIDDLMKLGVKINEISTQEKDGIFKGLNVVITGTLSSFKRKDAQKIIEDLGGRALSDVTKNTNLVIVGQDAGSKKAKAEKLGIKMIDEAEFLKMINK